jgi:hypothetical protein
MRPPFNAVLSNLVKSINSQNRDRPIDRYDKAILLIRESIREIQVLEKEFIKGRDSEVEFFRTVWPVFFGKLILYDYLLEFEIRRLSIPNNRTLRALIRRERRQVTFFLRTQREFLKEYRSGSPVRDKFFTRAFSRSFTNHHLAVLIDEEGATLGGCRVAQCLAMEGYRAWLAREWRATNLYMER